MLQFFLRSMKRLARHNAVTYIIRPEAKELRL
jgi:hypothetical protein